MRRALRGLLALALLGAACSTSTGSTDDPTPSATAEATPSSAGTATPETTTSPAPAIGSVPDVATLVSSYGPDERGNGWHVEYPKVRGIDPAIADRINAEVEQRMGIGMLGLPEGADEYDGIRWDETATFTVGLATPELLSFAVDHHLYTGGAHGLPSSWYLTFDLTTGEVVEPVDLLAPSAREVLSPLVRQDLDDQLDQEHDATDDVLLVNDAWSSGFDRFGDLHLTFQAYGLGSYSLGLPTVTFAPFQLRELGLVPAQGLLADALQRVATAREDDEAALLAAVEAHRADPATCDGDVAESLGPGLDHVLVEANDLVTVFVRCWDAAYQTLFEATQWDGRELQRLQVEQWDGTQLVTDAHVLGYPGPEHGGITNLNRFRGVGDCGILSQWWPEPGRLRLVQAQQQDCRDDAEFVPPEQWPVVWAG